MFSTFALWMLHKCVLKCMKLNTLFQIGFYPIVSCSLASNCDVRMSMRYDKNKNSALFYSIFLLMFRYSEKATYFVLTLPSNLINIKIFFQILWPSYNNRTFKFRYCEKLCTIATPNFRAARKINRILIILEKRKKKQNVVQYFNNSSLNSFESW